MGRDFERAHPRGWLRGKSRNNPFRNPGVLCYCSIIAIKKVSPVKIDSLKSQSNENLILARAAIDNLLAERARKALETTAGHFGLSVAQIMARDLPATPVGTIDASAVLAAERAKPKPARGRPRKSKGTRMVDGRGIIWAGQGRKPKGFDASTAQPAPTVPANGTHATA